MVESVNLSKKKLYIVSVLYNMKKNLTSICILAAVIGVSPLFAAEDMVGCDPKTYDCYMSKVASRVNGPWFDSASHLFGVDKMNSS